MQSGNFIMQIPFGIFLVVVPIFELSKRHCTIVVPRDVTFPHVHHKSIRSDLLKSGFDTLVANFFWIRPIKQIHVSGHRVGKVFPHVPVIIINNDALNTHNLFCFTSDMSISIGDVSGRS
jgi:hypothetical protein